MSYLKSLISAGHSDSDPGCSGNGLIEAKWAVAFRDEVVTGLRMLGHNPLVDSNLQSRNLPLVTAIKMIGGGVLAVEFHLNSSVNSQATGVEVLYAQQHLNRVGNFAAKLSSAISKTLAIRDRGIKPDTSSPRKFLGFCRHGGLIVETFFASNPFDAAFYKHNSSELAARVAKEISDELRFG